MEGTKPVNKKLAAALSGGAVLVLALSACSGDESNEELDAWAKKICNTATAPNAKIAAADAAINKVATDSEPEELQKVDSKSFGDLADGFKERATHLQDAGAPPGVDGGATKQQDAVKKLNAVSTAYADLKKQVDALNTKDQAKFASGLNELSNGMKDVVTLRKNAVAALKQLEEGDAKASLVKQESCKKAAASASATDS
ncbi:small secreted protein [Streptomyces sp. DG2A-72]|uniref:small secreted protein n=1 Tax=Streptomyces sp. DG2A-72 TaxID=3051386 RepID=UPI00265C2218|nr:small secreted protein [Streptomyces sp. DG2A-72]MDO0935242.1 small secreted protein [Streptomyces sp. DG2A-72]